jgi:hypothetical protein
MAGIAILVPGMKMKQRSGRDGSAPISVDSFNLPRNGISETTAFVLAEFLFD